jgi:hypothetical protein
MKFSIRDLLLVTVIVALAVGWWVDRANYRGLHEENVRLSKRLEETDHMLMEVFAAVSRKRQGIIWGPKVEEATSILPSAPNPPKK